MERNDTSALEHLSPSDVADSLASFNLNPAPAEDFTEAIFEKVLTNKALKKFKASLNGIKRCCKSTFKSLAVPDKERFELCRNPLRGHKNDAWIKARKLRITASRIYRIYTYTQNNKRKKVEKEELWKKKSEKYFWPKKFKNKYVTHGIDNEQLARETYKQHTIKKNVEVVQCGFIVHREHQWTGVSPDGLVFEKGRPKKLIEIKCPYPGKDKPIKECLSSCKFLDKNHRLKKKHPYYGQIQLGMLLCNVEECDFILFASFDKSIEVISVPFDKKFALEMFKVVRKTYFENMLHYICLHNKEQQAQSKRVSSMAR